MCGCSVCALLSEVAVRNSWAEVRHECVLNCRSRFSSGEDVNGVWWCMRPCVMCMFAVVVACVCRPSVHLNIFYMCMCSASWFVKIFVCVCVSGSVSLYCSMRGHVCEVKWSRPVWGLPPLPGDLGCSLEKLSDALPLSFILSVCLSEHKQRCCLREAQIPTSSETSSAAFFLSKFHSH